MASIAPPRPAADRHGMSTQSTTDAPADAGAPMAARVRRKLRKVLGSFLAVTLLLAAGYGAGHLHAWFSLRADRQAVAAQLDKERGEVARAQHEFRVELARRAEQVERLQAQHAQMEGLAVLNEGYRRLHGAVDALEARNFGTAESRVREAEQLLARRLATIPRLPALVGGVSELRISVASDLASQRGALRSLLRELGELIESESAALQSSTAQP